MLVLIRPVAGLEKEAVIRVGLEDLSYQGLAGRVGGCGRYTVRAS